MCVEGGSERFDRFRPQIRFFIDGTIKEMYARIRTIPTKSIAAIILTFVSLFFDTASASCFSLSARSKRVLQLSLKRSMSKANPLVPLGTTHGTMENARLHREEVVDVANEIVDKKLDSILPQLYSLLLLIAPQ